MIQTVASLGASTHAVDLDASVDNVTSAPAGQYRSVWAVTMELAAAGVAAKPHPMPRGQERGQDRRLYTRAGAGVG